MRSLYGTRSIIPNNYYFTFDKIYDNLSDIDNNDSVMIGRTALCQQDHTVWLKTVNGYIRVAKLDEEGKFKFLEGYNLSGGADINNLRSYGNTPNGNGVYILNYDNVGGNLDSYPSIKGMTQSNYLKGTTFLLEQYSNTIELSLGTPASNYENGAVYYYKDGDGYYKTAVSQKEFEAIQSEDKALYTLNTQDSEATILTYQILTDISNTLTDKPDDSNILDTVNNIRSGRAFLFHNNKTFMRRCSYKYTKATGDTVESGTIYYQYNPIDLNFIEVVGTGNKTSTSGLFVREISENWSSWDDLSEQYTGYIGDLDPLLIENKKSSNNNNLNTSSNLVEALNTHDKIIGSDSRINKNGIVNNIEYGSLSSNLSDDYRNYNIPEDNIMDAIVHHDADIGQIETDITKYTTYNLEFIKDTTDETNLTGTEVELSNIKSLTSAIRKLDNILGSQKRLMSENFVNIAAETTGKASEITNREDARPYNVPECNVIDSIIHHDADIGNIEDLKAGSNNKNTNNLQFIADPERTEGDIKNIGNIQSLTQAIQLLDKIIGAYRRFDDKEVRTTDKTLIHNIIEDYRPTNLQGENIIDALLYHDADIGQIKDLDSENLKFDKSQSIDINNSFIERTKGKQYINSLTDAIVLLDKLIGNIDESLLGYKHSTTSGDNGFYAKTIIGALEEHDSEIGELEWFNSQDQSLQSPNINYGSEENQVKTLVEAIILLDKILGNFNNSLIGNKKKDEKGNYDGSSIGTYANTIVGAISEHDAEIGELENLISDDNEINDSANLVEVINKLNNFIGVISKLSPTNDGNLVSAINKNHDEIGENIEDIQNIYYILSELRPIVEGNSNTIDNHEERITNIETIDLVDLRKLINTMSYNMDIMDTTIADLASQANLGESSGSLKWGSF